MSWSINEEGPLQEVIERIDRHRLQSTDAEQERQYDRVKQMALAELRSYPAQCRAGNDRVKVSLAAHRSHDCYGSMGISIHGEKNRPAKTPEPLTSAGARPQMSAEDAAKLAPVPVGTETEATPQTTEANGIKVTATGAGEVQVERPFPTASEAVK
jgi:hypothetical protein